LERNDETIEAEIDDNLSGFRPKRGKRWGIFNLRAVTEKYLEVQKPVHVCFI